MSTPVFFTSLVYENGGGPIIYVQGEIDSATCGGLRDAIEPHVGPEKTVALDIGGVWFMSSACLNVFVQMHKALTNHGGSLVLRNPSAIAQRLLVLTGLEFLIANHDADRSPAI